MFSEFSFSKWLREKIQEFQILPSLKKSKFWSTLGTSLKFSMEDGIARVALPLEKDKQMHGKILQEKPTGIFEGFVLLFNF